MYDRNNKMNVTDAGTLVHFSRYNQTNYLSCHEFSSHLDKR